MSTFFILTYLDWVDELDRNLECAHPIRDATTDAEGVAAARKHLSSIDSQEGHRTSWARLTRYDQKVVKL